MHDRRELSAGRRDRRLERGNVVERHATKIAARPLRNARGVVRRPVEPPEVSAPDHDVARGVRTRDPDRGGDRLGARLEKLHFVRARNDAAQPLGDVDLAYARQSAHVAARDRIDDRARDVRLGVAERDGAERHRAVEVLVAVGVGDATSDGAE